MKIQSCFLLLITIVFGGNNVKKKYPEIDEKPEKHQSVNPEVKAITDSSINAISDSTPHLK